MCPEAFLLFIACIFKAKHYLSKEIMSSVAIVQSNYIPWKGYFDLIASVDHFVIYDDVQYTNRDWRNRNKIKTPSGSIWLSVPVGNNRDKKIYDVVIEDPSWQQSHWKSLQLNYAKAPHFKEIIELLEPYYLGEKYDRLNSLNTDLINLVCSYLGIQTKIHQSRDFVLDDGQNEKLAGIVRDLRATTYVSGAAAQGYLEESYFREVGASVEWFNYGENKEYSQLWGDFEPNLSILDLLFNCGRESTQFMNYVEPAK